MCTRFLKIVNGFLAELIHPSTLFLLYTKPTDAKLWLLEELVITAISEGEFQSCPFPEAVRTAAIGQVLPLMAVV
jgi:hypothetical protein